MILNFYRNPYTDKIKNKKKNSILAQIYNCESGQRKNVPNFLNVSNLRWYLCKSINIWSAATLRIIAKRRPFTPFHLEKKGPASRLFVP